MSFFNWLIDPVKNQYVDFNGRTSRKAYWMFVLVYVIVAVVIAIIEEVIGINVIGYIFALALLVPSVAIAVRRLHDTGLSGWFALIGLIPLLGFVIMIILLVRKSEEGANKYGAHPSVADLNQFVRDVPSQ